jgi:hypothetical protein
MYFISKNLWFTIHVDSWFWRIIDRICWACAIFCSIPNLICRHVQTDRWTDRITRGSSRLNPIYYYSLLCIYVVPILLWRPANSNECRFSYHCRRRASDCCNFQRGSRNKLISHLFYHIIINPSMAASSNPFRWGSRGWGVFIYGNHAARRENSTSWWWWGCLCDVCFASKKSSEREFFIPAGSYLAKQLLHVFDALVSFLYCVPLLLSR